MKDISEILKVFEPVQLSQIDAVKLLNRVDTKFVIKADILPELLHELSADYFILEINGIRMSHYDTVYYDTPDFFYYYQHQSGRLSRTKVRLRTYEETGQTYLEVKTKNNHRKTTKNRISIQGPESLGEKVCKKFLKSYDVKYKEIVPVIDVKYSRITLVNRNFTERLTIDTGLNFKYGDNVSDFSELCIIELKQDKSAKSNVREILRRHRIFQSSLSKYCLGIASLYENVRKNNIKEKIRAIKKLCYETI